jgi:ribosomal protein S18 acetylase RimI-like enzyme
MSSSPLRELREEDADAVAALFGEAFGDARPADGEEIRSWFRNEELRPEWLRVLERDGAIVGYGDIWIQDDELALDVAAPGCWDAFFEWAEHEGRDAGVPQIRSYFPAGHELAALVAARGYRPGRSSFTMEAVLDGATEAPGPPNGIALRTFREQDAEALRAALNDAFAETPGHHDISPLGFREFHLNSRGVDTTLWTLAWSGDDVAGFVLAYPERVGDPALGWVGTLAVRKPWRRRGLGGTLLLTSFRDLYDRGRRRAGLGVDAENVDGAVRLYERAGMHVVQRFDNWVREP